LEEQVMTESVGLIVGYSGRVIIAAADGLGLILRMICFAASCGFMKLPEKRGKK
jgi:hypothetical protein